jgi:hypothetical protein
MHPTKSNLPAQRGPSREGTALICQTAFQGSRKAKITFTGGHSWKHEDLWPSVFTMTNPGYEISVTHSVRKQVADSVVLKVVHLF